MSRPFTEQCFEARSMLVLDDEAMGTLRKAVDAEVTSTGFMKLGKMSLDASSVFVGLKTRVGVGGSVGRWAREAWLADRVMSRFPETQQNFPNFTLPVKDLGWWLGGGLLTEDFTEGDEKDLVEYNNRRKYRGFLQVERGSIDSELERKVYDTLSGVVNAEAFSHMTGRVSDREVMIDFDDIAYSSQMEGDIEEYVELASQIAIQLPPLV